MAHTPMTPEETILALQILADTARMLCAEQGWTAGPFAVHRVHGNLAGTRGETAIVGDGTPGPTFIATYIPSNDNQLLTLYHTRERWDDVASSDGLSDRERTIDAWRELRAQQSTV